MRYFWPIHEGDKADTAKRLQIIFSTRRKIKQKRHFYWVHTKEPEKILLISINFQTIGFMIKKY